MKSLSNQLFEQLTNNRPPPKDRPPPNRPPPKDRPPPNRPPPNRPPPNRPHHNRPHHNRPHHNRPSPRIQYIGYDKPTWRNRLPFFRNRIVVDRQVPVLVPTPVIHKVESPVNKNLYYIIIVLILAFIGIFAAMKYYN